MSMPLNIDTEIVTGDEVVTAVESVESDGGLLSSEERARAARLVLYPAFIVEYGYSVTTGLVRKQTEQKTDAFLVDGLNADNDPHLQQYTPAAKDPEAVGEDELFSWTPDDDPFVRPVVPDAILSREAAGNYLYRELKRIQAAVEKKRAEGAKRAEEYRMQGNGKKAQQVKEEAASYTGEDLLDELRTDLNIDASVDFNDNFAGISDVELVRLPFWVVHVERANNEGGRYLAFRRVSSGITGGVSPDETSWLSSFFTENLAASKLFDGRETAAKAQWAEE